MTTLNTTIRSFVAIQLPGEVKQALSEISHSLAGRMGPAARAVRWTRPESTHLTMQFLGDVPVGMKQLIQEALIRGSRDVGPLHLSLGATGVFPNLQRPRVLWVGVTGKEADIDALDTLQCGVSGELATLGFEPDKAFKAHLTLGRVREGASADDIRAISQAISHSMEQPPVKCRFEVREITLMKSDLRPTSSVYTAMAVIPLRPRT